jgi:hypothetical protein
MRIVEITAIKNDGIAKPLFEPLEIEGCKLRPVCQDE